MKLDWVRLPSNWVQQRGLKAFKWEARGAGANQIAALMVLTVVAHNADQETGEARLTYDDFCAHTELSRAKVARGIAIVEERQLIKRPEYQGQSTFQLVDFDRGAGWAKFPAKSMYSGKHRIAAFADFRLRKAVELDALKLFFLFAARRDNNTNRANISYPTIEEYTAVPVARIKSATSFLASHSLIYIDHVPSQANEHGVANAYRVAGIDPRRHMGTLGRSLYVTED